MKLFKVGNDLYVLNYKDRKAMIFDGLPELFAVAQRIEIPFNEMETALTEMLKQDHNCAEFGFKNTFTVSFKV